MKLLDYIKSKDIPITPKMLAVADCNDPSFEVGGVWSYYKTSNGVMFYVFKAGRDSFFHFIYDGRLFKFNGYDGGDLTKWNRIRGYA
tara:strand:- start:7164 stop:7424 length:261 start_codon:yes stop_codon:yes gene_type:complete